MKKHLLTCILTCAMIPLYLAVNGQTAGSGTLSSIESKADAISRNDEKVAELNRKRMDSYAAENDKLLELKKQLADLRAEKSRARYELQNGYYCSKCNTPKSEFEARGESFERHLASVSGRAVPADPSVIKSKMEEYDRRIAAKEAAVKKFELEENEFSRKRADFDRQMNELKANSDRLREEIVELSKAYKEKVMAEAKAMHIFWAGDLMRTAAEKHFVEDRINILQVKQNDLQAEESKATAALKDKVAKKNEADKKQLDEKIAANNYRLPALEQAYRERVSRLEGQLAQWQTRLIAVNADLINTASLAADDLQTLQSEKSDLETKISTAREQLSEYETAYNRERQTILDENKMLSDKKWDLTVNLPKIQEAALEGLRDAFTAKRKILQDAVVARKASLESLGRLLQTKKDAYRQKHLQYAAKVDAERIRLLRACQKAGCSCYGVDTHGEVNGNWNRTLGCVGEMEGAHASGDPVYGCAEEGAIYQQHYHSMVNGLSDSDLEALQRVSSKTRYDMIFRKITN